MMMMIMMMMIIVIIIVIIIIIIIIIIIFIIIIIIIVIIIIIIFLSSLGVRNVNEIKLLKGFNYRRLSIELLSCCLKFVYSQQCFHPVL